MSTLRFSVGVMKGCPLESAGAYTIVKLNGEDVAQFTNGSLAKFYVDENESKPQSIKTETGPSAIETSAEQVLPSVTLKLDPGATGFVPLPQKKLARQLVTVRPRRSIGVYTDENRRRTTNPCESVYCILEEGRELFSYDRQTVGNGLREYLWLYEQLRKLGRNWFAALFEARILYYL